jgi:hypothetical protein
VEHKITLKNEKIRSYNQISWLLVILHLIVFLYLAIFSTDKRISTTALTSVIILGVVLGYNYYQKKRSGPTISFTLQFYFMTAGWIATGISWPLVFPVIFGLLSDIATRPLIAIFKLEKIIYPSFPARSIQWSELKNVLLKDGLLTIDLKNNKLIQQEIDEKATQVDEKDFNEFCRDQLIHTAST